MVSIHKNLTQNVARFKIWMTKVNFRKVTEIYPNNSRININRIKKKLCSNDGLKNIYKENIR